MKKILGFGSCVSDVISGVVLGLFGPFHLAIGISREMVVFHLTLWHLAAFGDFRKKTPKRAWLFAGISPLLYGLRTWSKRQKMRQVF